MGKARNRRSWQTWMMIYGIISGLYLWLTDFLIRALLTANFVWMQLARVHYFRLFCLLTVFPNADNFQRILGHFKNSPYKILPGLISLNLPLNAPHVSSERISTFQAKFHVYPLWMQRLCTISLNGVSLLTEYSEGESVHACNKRFFVANSR